MNLPSLSIFKKRKKIIYYLILLVFSILFNQYYGYIGVFPTDSFLIFNSGYDFMNGYFPFKDFYSTTGPLLDMIQAIFYNIFGVSWFSYVFHASLINALIAIATFYTLNNFKLNINYCFLYSLLVSILAYPSSGTPFMDHHSTFFSIIALYSFMLAIKTRLNIFWFIMPIFLGLSFLSKQVPAGYFFFIISFFSIIYFIFNFDVKKISIAVLSGLLFITLFFVFILLNKIPVASFFEQYILFPQTLGKDRFDLLLPFDLKKIILRYKLIHLASLLMIILIIKKIIKDYKYLKNDEFIIIITLIFSSYSLIILELMTINEKFIFFIIPILIAFSHVFYQKYFSEKKFILYSLIIFSISTTFWYQYNYISNREFLSLDKSLLKNTVDAKLLDEKFNGLKWVTLSYHDNPKEEIDKLKDALKIMKNDNRNKTIITDYQFISVILSTYDYSPSKVWHNGATYPESDNKYFKSFKRFFIKKLNENNINVIYIVNPFYVNNENNILSILSNECYQKSEVTDILNSYVLTNCSDLSEF